MAVASHSPPPDLAAAWDQALAGWTEPPRHAAILAVAAQHRAFAWAATRYREYLAAHPDDPVATAALERINKAALATLYATATQQPEAKLSRQTAMLLVLGILAIIIMSGVFLLSKIKDHPTSPPSMPAKARRP